MKKVIAIMISAVLMLSLIPTVALAGNGHGNGANAFDVNGAHYNLNLIGKKANWNEKSGFSNPDRHTIFIPEDTTGFGYIAPDGTAISDSIKLEIGLDKNSDDIYVTDGTAFDGDGIGIMMPDKKYYVFIASRGKPTSENANIDAMVYYDSTLGEWLFLVGEVSVTRGWQTAEDLFWVTQTEHDAGTGLGGTLPVDPMWIFDYLEWLGTLNDGEADPTETMEYYWDIDNNGNKLIKLRFYPM